MSPIRILLGLEDASLSRAFAAQTDISVVGQAVNPLELLLMAGECSVDVVVIPIEPDRAPGVTSLLFAQYPDITVVGLAPGGGVYIEQMCPCRRDLNGASLNALLEEMRLSVREPCRTSMQLRCAARD